jgi:hypothetical protein
MSDVNVLSSKLFHQSTNATGSETATLIGSVAGADTPCQPDGTLATGALKSGPTAQLVSSKIQNPQVHIKRMFFNFLIRIPQFSTYRTWRRTNCGAFLCEAISIFDGMSGPCPYHS